MATYLQGVTDYIPDYQPFQPDYNFYNTVLQARQTKYDTNWKSLNNIYSNIYNANLTHEDNIAKKEDLLKQIDFNVKRVAGLDLSLQQNVDQAMQVFKPFYDDQYLMKDMAWTKNFINKYSAAEKLLTSQDEKQRAQYWPTGLKEMMYRREEFKNSTLEETLNFSNVTYTPYINAVKKYMDLAKELGISAEISTPPTGSTPYTVTMKNGDILLPTLNQLFTSTYANDPALQRIYATRAYVNRKDAIQQNLVNYNNDPIAAEKAYLNEQYNTLKAQIANVKNESSENLNSTENKLATVNNDFNDGNINFNSKGYLAKLQELYGVEKVIDEHVDKLNNEINEESATAVTQGPTSGLDLNNMELARLKVDAVYANMLAQKDILDASDAYADIGKKVSYNVDPYYMEKVKDANARGRLKLAADLKEKQAIELKGVEDGIYEIDYNTNKIKRDRFGKPVLAADYKPNGAGSVLTTVTTDEMDIKKSNENFRQNQRTEYLSGYIDQALNFVNSATTGANPPMSAEEANYILGGKDQRPLQSMGPDLIRTKDRWGRPSTSKWYGFNPKTKEYELGRPEERVAVTTEDFYQIPENTYKAFKTSYDEDKGGLVKTLDDTDVIYDIKDRLDNWMKKHSGLGLATDYLTDETYARQRIAVDNYKAIDQVNDLIDKSNQVTIAKLLADDLKKALLESEMPSRGIIPSSERITDEEYRQRYLDEDLSLSYKKIKNRAASFFALNPNISKEEFSKELLEEIKTEILVDAALTGKKDFMTTWMPQRKAADIVETMYETLSKSYSKAISSPQVKSYVGYKEIEGPDGKSSLALMSNGDKVNLKYGNLPGTKSFAQFLDDINKINWNQTGDFKVSIGLTEGNELIGAETSSAAQLSPEKTQALRNMLNDIYSKKGTKSKLGTFEMYSIDAGLEKEGLATMLIKLTPEILKGYQQTTKEGEITGVGYFTTEELNAMVQGGIAFVAPDSYWSNDLYQRNKVTPIEGILNAEPNKKYIYTDQNGAGQIFLSKGLGGRSGDYNIDYRVKAFDPNTGRVVEERRSVPYYAVLGKNIDNQFFQSVAILQNTSAQNLKYLIDAQRAGNQELVDYLSKEFSVNTPEIQLK